MNVEYPFMRTHISTGKLPKESFSFLFSVPGEQETKSLARHPHVITMSYELKRKNGNKISTSEHLLKCTLNEWRSQWEEQTLKRLAETITINYKNVFLKTG